MAEKGKWGHKTSEQKLYKLYYLQASDEEFIYKPRMSPVNGIGNNESFPPLDVFLQLHL